MCQKTGVAIEHLTERTTTRTCPKCRKHNRPKGRDYRCSCGFRCHRNAVGAINIWLPATYGELIPIGADVCIRVTCLRAVPRWSGAPAVHQARSTEESPEPGRGRTGRK